jgi:hypothetical protein
MNIQRKYLVWLLLLACVLGSSGCRTALTTQTSVALNTYQTAQTMPAGGFGYRMIGPSLGGSRGAMLDIKSFERINTAMYVGGGDFQVGLGNGWDVGGMAKIDFNFRDACGSLRPYVKIRLTENNSSFIASLLIGGEYVGGGGGSRSPEEPEAVPTSSTYVDSTRVYRNAFLSSYLWRISCSIPMNFAISGDRDIILHPGLHYLQQHISGNERFYYVGVNSQMITTSFVSRDQVHRYIVPSLSVGIRPRYGDFVVQPEFTIALAGNIILWSIGISVQFGTFGEPTLNVSSSNP